MMIEVSGFEHKVDTALVNYQGTLGIALDKLRGQIAADLELEVPEFVQCCGIHLSQEFEELDRAFKGARFELARELSEARSLSHTQRNRS